MYHPIERDTQSDEAPRQETGIVIRTSFITQLHATIRVDIAVLDALCILAHTVSDFAALPDLRIVSTCEKSASARGRT